MHTSAKGNQLFAIAANVFKRHGGARMKSWNIEIAYVHAKDLVSAKLGYCRANPNRRSHQIISVGLAIGFFHTGFDKSGSIVKDQLSAD